MGYTHCSFAHIGGLEIKGGSKGQLLIIQIIVNFWMALPKSKQPSEENKIYIRLKAAITDSLMLVKFNFLLTQQKF